MPSPATESEASQFRLKMIVLNATGTRSFVSPWGGLSSGSLSIEYVVIEQNSNDMKDQGAWLLLRSSVAATLERKELSVGKKELCPAPPLDKEQPAPPTNFYLREPIPSW
jgi:hypothetical protein